MLAESIPFCWILPGACKRLRTNVGIKGSIDGTAFQAQRRRRSSHNYFTGKRESKYNFLFLTNPLDILDLFAQTSIPILLSCIEVEMTLILPRNKNTAMMGAGRHRRMPSSVTISLP